MNTYNDRIADAASEPDVITLGDRLIDAARAAGYTTADDFADIREAITWTAIQCDTENDDYETIEATFLARLEDADKTGER